MTHLHWPHWAERVIDDVEREGELQIIGFVLVVTTLIGTLVFSFLTMIAALVRTFS